jgi:hypothetical protein
MLRLAGDGVKRSLRIAATEAGRRLLDLAAHNRILTESPLSDAAPRLRQVGRFSR